MGGSSMHAGVIGGTIGCVVGVVGGVIGTYFSIRNTNGVRERQFMIKAAALVWVLAIVFIGLILFLPNPYRWFVYLPVGLLMGMGIPYLNKKQQLIRDEEAGENRGENG